MKDTEPHPTLRTALLALLFATPVWTWVFRGRRGNFWTRMTLGAGSLGLFALRARPELREQLPRPRDIPEGVASAAGLYLIFQIGDRVVRRIMPAGEEEIENIYRLRTLAPKGLITPLLVGVIGPSEELFWRGLIQHTFMRRFGRWRGTAAAAAAYGGIHLVTGNVTLTGAAGVAGVYWGTEFAISPRLGPLLVSHIIWDVWIFLVAPTPTGRKRD